MTKGRIPKPKAINDLKGDTHRRRRHQVEPTPPNEHPKLPDHLGDIAKDHWSWVTDVLDRMRLLSTADAAAIAAYCSAYERYRHAEAQVRKFGSVVKTPNNSIQTSPYVSQLHRELEVCRRYEIEFGLTPAARSRMAIPKDNKTTGNLIDFLLPKK